MKFKRKSHSTTNRVLGTLMIIVIFSFYLISVIFSYIEIADNHLVLEISPLKGNTCSPPSGNIISKNPTFVNQSGIDALQTGVYSKVLYQPHTPISINGNADFLNQAASEGWSGNGSSSNPYILEGYNITGGGNLVNIQNTDVHFVFRNNLLNGATSNGIRLYGVYNGLINNVSIYNCPVGIYSEISGSIKVKNTQIVQSSFAGISLSENAGLIFVNNSLLEVGIGIYLHFFASGMTVSQNMIHKANTGIKLVDDSENNIITNNTVSSCTEFGIFLSSSSSNNLIKHNNFINNNVGGSSQAHDDGAGNSFSNNHWDNWISPDVDHDGVVDLNYPVNGSASNADLSPFISRVEFLLGRQVHLPISITGNLDFSNQASLEGFHGNGTQTNPYIIQNLFIKNASSILIAISTTNVYFKIYNCVLDGVNNSYNGLLLSNVQNGLVDETIIQECTNGIRIESYSVLNTINNSKIYSNIEDGLTIHSSSNISLYNNEVFNNTWYGLRLYASFNNTLRGNQIHSNYWSGIKLYGASMNEISENHIRENIQRGIHISTSANKNRIFKNYLRKNSLDGICIEFNGDSNEIINNLIVDNGNNGVRIDTSSKNLVQSNLIENHFWSGLNLKTTSNFTVIQNNSIFNNKVGIYFQSGSHNNSIIENQILKNMYDGIRLNDVSYNTITDNTITESSWAGINIESLCHFNSIEGNTISYNNLEGVKISSTSTYNSVKNNHFTNNAGGLGACQAFDDGSSNVFLFNFWNEWEEPDENVDGIVDIPYSINGLASNVDSFPKSFIIGLIPHEAILISGDDELNNQAILEGWMGNGSVSNPFIINGYNITTTNRAAIQVESTNLFFNIERCLLRGNSDGVYLNNVRNGIIKKNIITNVSTHGIYMENSHNNILSSNTIINIDADGIGAIYSDNNSIINNRIYDCLYSGIYLSNSVVYTIRSNIISNNGLYGIYPYQSSNYTIVKNLVMENGQYGIYLFDSAFSIVTLNDIITNIEYGVYLRNSYEIKVKLNNFQDNNLNGNSQAYSDTDSNVYQFNYWNDWVASDTNLDEILDLPYPIDGFSNEFDLYPLVMLIDLVKPTHVLTLPVLTYPNGGEVLQETELIQWIFSIDSYDHSISYSLYWSSDGSSWQLLKSDLLETSWNWDTSTLLDGDQYRLKVVASCEDNQINEDYSDNVFRISQPSGTTTKTTSTSSTTTQSIIPSLTTDWKISFFGFIFPIIIFKLKRKEK